MARPLVVFVAVLALASCHRPAASSPDAGHGPYAHAADGGIVQHEVPKACTPHVDGSDADHRVFLVETAARQTDENGRATLDLLALDTAGACDFSTRTPASYHGVHLVLTAPASIVPEGHYLIDGSPSGATLTFISTGKNGEQVKRAALNGSVDLISRDPKGVSIGFNVHDATGASYGCFSATFCSGAK